MKDIKNNRQQRQREMAKMQSTARKRKKYKRSYIIYYIMLMFFVAVAGISLSLTLFFNIETIQVKGNDTISESEILKYVSAKTGDNLFRISTNKIEQSILNNIINIDSVTVKRSLPETLVITVKPATPKLSLAYKQGYMTASEGFRILEDKNSQPAENTVVISGLEVDNLKKGDFLETENKKIDIYKQIQKNCNEAELFDITEIDLSNVGNIKIVYQNRINIKLVDVTELSYKIKYAKYLLTEKISDNESGDIVYMLEKNRVDFIPKNS